MLPAAAAMKLAQESNTSSSLRSSAQLAGAEVHGALIDRSSSHRAASRQQELDAAVSAKGIPIVSDVGNAMASGGEAFVDGVSSGAEVVGNEVVSAGTQTLNTLEDAGMAVGTAAANGAVVVGNGIAEGAESTFNAVAPHVVSFGNSLGEAAVSVGNEVAELGERVVDETVTLAGTVLDHAKKGVEQGAKMVNKVGKAIGDKMTELGEEVAKLGPIIAGLAKSAWNEIKDFVSCLAEGLTLCSVLIGEYCDCNAGSYIKFSTDSMDMRCIFKVSADFGKGYGVTATSGGQFGVITENGRITLPGDELEQSFKAAGSPLRARKAMDDYLSPAPSGSCETSLEVAVDGVVQFAPDLMVTVNTDGDTKMTISGSVRSSIDSLVRGQGSCSFTAEKRFPKKPLKKVICAKAFCLVIALQMVAELEMTGTLTGTITTSSEVDFNIYGTVDVNPKGEADVSFNTPEITHQEGWAIGASALASVRVGAGPVLTVWPMPGVPVNFKPMFNAQAQAQGTLEYKSYVSLLQDSQSVLAGTDSNMTSVVSENMTLERAPRELSMCNAAALSIYADADITAFALPPAIRGHFSTNVIKEALEKAVMAGATALLNVMNGVAKCVPGMDKVTEKINAAATAAKGALSSLIPSLNLDFNLKSIVLMAPETFWCKEVYTTPGFDTAPCAAELGCKTAGRSSEPGNEVPPPEQFEKVERQTEYSSKCYDIPMGDNFIQLGDWRLAAIDYNHFSISHRELGSGIKTAQIFRSDGTLHPGPRSDWGAWHLHKGGQTIQIYRQDGTLHPGPRTDWSTWDRRVGNPVGITFGDRFVQLGNFRLGDADGGHFLVSHINGWTCQIYRWDGTRHPGPRRGWGPRLLHRKPMAWSCEGIAEMAFGPCDSDFGTFGDRFIQLGQWRIAAIDANHFSVSHKGGKTAQIYRSDGTLHPGPRSDFGSWNRPTGFPYGITFGPGFIQIGNFRLAAMDDTHFTVSHRYHGGRTAQIYRSDATLHPGPRSDWDAWGLSAGPPTGITFGDRFLQIGKFRLGDADGGHLVLTHENGKSLQIFRSDGHVVPVQTHRTAVINARPAHQHCRSIYAVLGSCPGIATGENFMEIGDWRLAAIDGNHFSVSHRDGKTAQIYRSDGTRHPGPRNDWGSWSWEPKKTGSHGKVHFGDHFIQFGNFRMGAVDDNHFSISHNGGKTIQIFRSDGTLHPGPRADFGLWHHSRPILDVPLGITFGDRFVQIGKFRVGDVDGRHFSVAHVGGRTMQIFREDGTLHPGPRSDFTTVGRPMHECRVADVEL
ncbi:unnamed protein product [Symbiodinium necroappetens]|uniref:Uncharacterized protein n=1 Tax=Symbiodinium necroappetens TaxID=1628268 RepID=A0A813C9C6_9DINO|nr:unnamed protein product [Symbiodinium necroappetens]